jgi:hypothetical protein
VEYAYITADEYTPQNVIAMEKDVLSLLSFNLQVPTSIHFIKLYARVLHLNPLTELIACYIADLQLLLTNQLQFKPSLVGSVCIFEAYMAQNHELPKLDIDANFRLFIKLFGHLHQVEEFKEAEKVLRHVWQEIR